MRIHMVLASVLLTAGCAGDKDTEPPPPTDSDTETTPVETADTAPPLPGPDLVWAPEASYTYDASWTLQSVDARAGFDIVLNWGAVTTGVWGDPVEPTALDQVILAELGDTEAEVLEALASDTMRPTSAITWWRVEQPSGVFASASDLSLEEGTVFDPPVYFLENPNKTWLLLLATADADDARLDLRTGLLVHPTAAGTTQLVVDDASGAVTWSATMPAESLRTASGHELYTVDWSALQSDVHGEDWDRSVTDELFLGRFDVGSADELIDDVLDLPSVAAEWYTMDVENENDARLDLAKDDGGASFTGFTSDGVWLMGIRCTTCFGPAPLALAVVEVVDP